jgi:putative chitinase
LTGKANYAAFAKDLNVDVVKDPDLVATPRYAALSAAWFWKKHRLNQLADAKMYQAVSRAINKSLDSFPQREAQRKRALEALCRAVLADPRI